MSYSTKNMRWHWLADLINKYQWKSGIEIGVAEGLTTQHIIKHTDIKSYYCIDPWHKKTHEWLHLKNVWGNHPALNIIRKPSDKAVKDVPVVDFVFIDGDHSYEQVKKDIENYLPKCRYFLCGHDYTHEGVQKAVTEKFGVVVTGGDSCWGYYVE